MIILAVCILIVYCSQFVNTIYVSHNSKKIKSSGTVNVTTLLELTLGLQLIPLPFLIKWIDRGSVRGTPYHVCMCHALRS